MNSARFDDYEVRCRLGAGGCGRVFLARDAAGAWVAVKVFDSLAVNRQLLARMTSRLRENGWPQGVLPVAHADFEGRPALQVTPWMGGPHPEQDADPKARSLQSVLHDHPGAHTWDMVRALARALAAMHDRRVAHGNLKPGNVFLNATDEVLLTDWAMGNMPGISRFDFTDAVLYQAPEQLANAEGYHEETGYRWDVYAFGALAYRLLTGRFPRCHETFSLVAQASGEQHSDGIQVDLVKLAEHLGDDPEITWPDAPGNELEAEFRRHIAACLELNAQRRPATMREVVAGFEALENRMLADLERNEMRGKIDKMRHRAGLALFGGIATATAAVVLAGLYFQTNNRLLTEKEARKHDIAGLTGQLESATAARDAAIAMQTTDRRTLSHATEIANERLVFSRRLGDQLFRWAMETGFRNLPPIDGREQRLKQLEAYYEGFLNSTAGLEDMRELHNHAHLQLAEIALSANDAVRGEERLAQALHAWRGQAMDDPIKFRVATAHLMLGLLHQNNGSDRAAEDFKQARTVLAEVPATTAGDRMRQLVAVLDYHEAKSLSSTGQDTAALERLHQATVTLTDLVRERPDCAVLRSELASCYLSSASVIEGLGLLGDAARIRLDALNTLLALYKKKPSDFAVRLDLAGCYGAMSETSLLAGDVAGADVAAKEALKLLEKLAAEQPDNAVVAERMAAQIGVGASILWDQGKPKEALEKFDTGIRILESIRANKPDDAMANYRLALLRWQQGRTLGSTGKRDQEITLLTDAAALLTTLESTTSPVGLPREQIQRSLAYLLSDLGHARQIAEQITEARAAFTASHNHWQRLLATRQDSEEYKEGESRCRQRLDELPQEKPKD